MKYIMHLFIIVILLVTAFSYAGTIPTYDLVDLGLNMDFTDWGDKINNNGQILCVSSSNYSGKPFIYDNGSKIFIERNYGSISAFPVDFNDIGQVLMKTSGYGASGTGVWQNGQLTDLGTPNGSLTTPIDINSKGQVIFKVANRSYLWDNGVTTDLNTLGGKTCTARSINDKGQIVGEYTVDSSNPKTSKRAFLFENGEMHDLGVGSAQDINESGQIAIRVDDYYSFAKVFLWEDGNLTDTDSYIYHENLGPIWLNNDGRITFYAGPRKIWTKELDYIDIDSLLPEGYKIDRMEAVNDNGYMLCNISKGSEVKKLLLVPSTEQAVIPPLFSYKPGLYSKPIDVKVTCTTENAVIHYTTNGAEPTENDPVIENGGTISINKYTILKAKAWRSDCRPSMTRKGEYALRLKKWKGLAMVSVPVVPSNTDPKLAVGFSDNYWYSYNPSAGNYTGYPDQYTWFDPWAGYPVKAYWAKFNEPMPVSEGQIIPYQGFVRYQLKPGWNMIGQPFVISYKWDRLKILVVPNGAIQPYAWGWRPNETNPFTGAYYRVGDPSVYPDATNIMEPFEGYWIRAKEECTMWLYR